MWPMHLQNRQSFVSAEHSIPSSWVSDPHRWHFCCASTSLLYPCSLSLLSTVLRSNRRDFDERVDESESETSRCRGVRDRSVCSRLCSRLWFRRWGVELLRLVNFPTLAPICCRSGEDLRRGSVRRRSGDDFRLGCVFRCSVVPLKRSSEEFLRRSSGDHLAILDPTGYLD